MNNKLIIRLIKVTINGEEKYAVRAEEHHPIYKGIFTKKIAGYSIEGKPTYFCCPYDNMFVIFEIDEFVIKNCFYTKDEAMRIFNRLLNKINLMCNQLHQKKETKLSDLKMEVVHEQSYDNLKLIDFKGLL